MSRNNQEKPLNTGENRHPDQLKGGILLSGRTKELLANISLELDRQITQLTVLCGKEAQKLKFDSHQKIIESLKTQLRQVYASRSWQITAPLRAISRRLTVKNRPHTNLPSEPSVSSAPESLVGWLSQLEHKVHKLDVLFSQYRSLLGPSVGIEGAVKQALMSGLLFCARHGLSLDSELKQANYAAAITELSAMTPVAVTRENPDVSIIVPVYGQLSVTLNCLHSLMSHVTHYTFEVVVADDASPEGTKTGLLGEIPWVRYIRQPNNQGFIANCNAAAATAHGRYLVFLNSDTRVVSDWLDELIGSFDVFPKAGLVGSKFYNADGSLQEAGGIWWRNGTAAQYGRNLDPDHPFYSFARRVDYCSGAAIAIPATLWAEVGGFDVKYSPAYCEDVELAFELRRRGYDAWLQPLSRVIHYEGKSHGQDVTSGVKAHQPVNMKRIAERWASVLESHGDRSANPYEDANRYANRRMLVLDERVPTPDRDSGTFITAKMIEAMRQLGWHVIFAPNNTSHAGKYTDDLQRKGVECLYAPYVNSLEQALELHPNVSVVLGYRVGVLAPVFDLIREKMPEARVIFHNVDLHYLRLEREAELLGDPDKQRRADMTREKEFRLISNADCTIVHTPVEKKIIEEQVPDAPILEFPYIADVHPSEARFAERHDIMFLGGYEHLPNVDAVKFFVSAVWPLLVDALPARARFLIVGARPPESLLDLASDRIVVTGQVADLAPYFDRARAFVSPLRFGAGIKGKIIQSMAHGLPSVISSISAEGIMLTPGREAFIADSPEAIKQAVLELYNDHDLWLEMQAAGYEFVRENYSWERGLHLCQKAIDIADETWTKRHQRGEPRN